MNLQALIKLCQEENGKVFVVGEDGEVKLVLLPPAEYERLRTGGGQAVRHMPEPEVVNREIVKAQLTGENFSVPATSAASYGPEHVSAALERARRRFGRSGYQAAPVQPDLRSEVIDPSFNFDEPEE